MHLVERECSLDFSARENHSGKIGSLEKAHKLLDGFFVVIDYIERDTSTKADHHDISRFCVFELATGSEPMLFEDVRDVGVLANRREAVIRDDDNVGLVGDLLFLESLVHLEKVAITIF